MKNYMHLEFDASSENEIFARNVVALFALPLEPSVSDISDIKTAVSEAVTNCVVHAYKGMGGKVVLECERKGGTLHIKILDEGCGMECVENAIKPFYTSVPEEERSGMGFTIMQTFMTDLKVESAIGKGTVVYMRKEIGSGKEQNVE